MEELIFKSIENMAGINFIIPSFQRGYRWSKENIINLFNDILENEEGYLLHSLCVGKNSRKNECSEEYIVVDGQQRLTAMYIILAVLYRNIEEEKFHIKIQYESRETSGEFLDFLFSYSGEVSSTEIQEDWEKVKKEMNLDFEYMIESYIGINSEIDKQKDNQEFELIKLKDKFMKAKFIWTVLEYQSKKDLIDKFGKINMGKIPLNNAELIKSEFLNYKNIDESFTSNVLLLKIENKQREVIKLWAEIEHTLHFADFWAFIPHKNQYRVSSDDINRIEYILQFYLFKQKSGRKDYELYMDRFRGDFILYDSFVSYLKGLNEEKHSTKEKSSISIMEEIYCLFKEIKSLYYNDGRNIDYLGDKNLYNYISYYVYYNDSVNENDYLNSFQLFYELLEKNRNEREKLVKVKIKEMVFKKGGIKNKILSVNYEDSKKEMLNLLLLYNVILISSTQGVGNRYNFLEHKTKTWTAEHIFPQKPEFNLLEDGSNIAEIKEFLSLITVNLDEKKKIVLKKEYALRYINYIYQKEKEIFTTQNENSNEIMRKCKVYPKALENKKKNKNGEEIVEFEYNIEKIEGLLSSKDEYEKRFANKMYLIVKASEFLEKLSIYEECRKLLNTKVEIAINEKKDFIKNNKSDFLEYSFPLIHIPKEEKNLDVVEHIRKEIETLNFKFTFQTAMNLEGELGKIKSKFEIIKQQEIEESKYKSEIISSPSDITKINISDEVVEINKIVYEVSFEHLDVLNECVINEFIKNYRDKIREEINYFFKEKFNELILDNSIANIALLDNRVNGNNTVGNKSFSDKKVAIFNLMKKGEFVPLSTILTFSNVYTKNKDTDKYWLYKSRCIYLRELIETIQCFFKD